MFQRLLYVSDSTEVGGPVLQTWAEILGASDRNNRRDGLTGVLLTHKGQFLQAVEGARVDVERLLGKLKADVRHTNLRILQNVEIAGRRFGDQPMRQCSVGPTAAGIIAGRGLHALNATEAGAVLEAACARAEIAA